MAAVESKLDTLDTELGSVEAKLDDGSRFTSDSEAAALEANLTAEIDANEVKIDAVANDLLVVDGKVDALETKLDTLDTDVGALETKLHDGTRYTDDAEAAALEANLAAEINANETKIDDLDADVAAVESKLDTEFPVIQDKLDGLEMQLTDLDLDVANVESKLDDETRFTDDAEAAALEANLTAEIDANEVKIDAVANDLLVVDGKVDALETKLDTLDTDVGALETKLDDETSFTDDAELAILETNLTTQIDANEALIIDVDADVAAVESKLDTLDTELGSVEAKLDDGSRFTSDSEAAALRGEPDG